MELTQMGQAANAAKYHLQKVVAAARNEALLTVADGLLADREAVLEANAADVEAAEKEDIRGYGAGEDEKLDMEYAPRHILMPSEYEEGEPVTVARHHIDTNRHVNNAQYVAVAREALPESLKVRQIRAEYKKAAVMGDVMVPRISREKGACTVALCSPEGTVYAVVWMQMADAATAQV